jgi:hypothetical protein
MITFWQRLDYFVRQLLPFATTLPLESLRAGTRNRGCYNSAPRRSRYVLACSKTKDRYQFAA